MERTLVDANRPWASVVGYSRAVRVGNLVEVSGTAAAGPDGRILAPGNVYGQAKAALETIGAALAEVGAGFEHVVRTRVYLQDPLRWEDAGRAHGEVFRDVRPANTTIGGVAFVDPDILVEIEVTAVVDGG